MLSSRTMTIPSRTHRTCLRWSSNPPSPMATDTSGTPVQPRRPRHALAMAAMATVLAIFFTAFGYQLRPLAHRQTPSHPVGSDEPSSTPSASNDKTRK